MLDGPSPHNQEKEDSSSLVELHFGVVNQTSTAGMFPGAFGGKLLLEACANANTFEKISPEDCYRGIALLKKAIHESGDISLHYKYKEMAHAVFRSLALEGNGSERVKLFEEALIKLHLESLPIIHAVLSNAGDIQSIDNILQSSNNVLAVEYVTEVETALSKDSKPSATQDLQIVAAEALAIAPMGKLVPFSSALGAPNDILETAISLAIKSHVLNAAWSNHKFDRQYLREQTESLSRDFDCFTQACNNRIESQGLRELAEAKILYLSPSLRTMHLVDGIVRLNNKHEALADRMRRVTEQEPFCGPQILLLAGLGRLFSESKETSEESVADTEMCDKASFLLMIKEGQVCFSHVRYDYLMGKLSSSSEVNVYRDFGRSWLPEEGSYQWEKLATIVNMFPAIDFKEVDAKLVELKSDSSFADYLADKEKRYGPRLIRNKKWLEPEEHNPKLISFLTELTLVLRHSKRLMQSNQTEAAQLQPKELLEKDFQLLSRIFANSFMMNTNGEEFLISFVKAAIESGKSLEEFRLENYGDKNAYAWMRNLEQKEALLSAGLVFNLEDKNGNKQGLRLSDFGVQYVLNLIDPTYKFHHTAVDCREYQELSARRDYHRYR